MTKYVVLLRGINVGGRIIKMADVRTCLEEAGYSDVKTILQTGNIVLDSDKNGPQLKKDLQGLLGKVFDYPAKLQVVTASTLEKIIKLCPYSDQDDSFHAYVLFMENGLEKQLVKEAAGLDTLEKVQLGDGVIYWRCAKGNTLQSSFGKQLAKATYKDFNTNRNLKTLRKIVAA